MRTISKTNGYRSIARAAALRVAAPFLSNNKIIKSNKQVKVNNAKIGSNMDFTRFRINKSVVETPNGVLKVFTLPDSESYVSGLLEIYLDGIQQIKDTDWTETTLQTFTFVNAPDSDENIRINYIKQ